MAKVETIPADKNITYMGDKWGKFSSSQRA